MPRPLNRQPPPPPEGEQDARLQGPEGLAQGSPLRHRRLPAEPQLPAEERFGLTAHLRKSATSIPSNIAEGCGREGERELARFLSIAAGSASESEYQLLLARDLGYLQPDVHRPLDDQVNEVKRMLNGFMKTLC
ncbi:MAG: four helix bundle protein [Polyangiaceae bacterium]